MFSPSLYRSLPITLSLSLIYTGKGPPQLRHGLSNPTTCRIRRVRRVRSHPDMERDPSHDLGGSIYIYIPVSGTYTCIDVDTLMHAYAQSSYIQELDLDDALKSPDAFYEFFSLPNPYRTEACDVYHCTCYSHASCVAVHMCMFVRRWDDTISA